MVSDLLLKKSCTYSSRRSLLWSKIPRGRLLSWLSLKYLQHNRMSTNFLTVSQNVEVRRNSELSFGWTDLLQARSYLTDRTALLLLEPSDSTVLYKWYNLQSWSIFSEADTKIMLTVCICSYLYCGYLERVAIYSAVVIANFLEATTPPPSPFPRPLESLRLSTNTAPWQHCMGSGRRDRISCWVLEIVPTFAPRIVAQKTRARLS